MSAHGWPDAAAPCSVLPHRGSGAPECLSAPCEVLSREQQGPLTSYTPPLHPSPAQREKVGPRGPASAHSRRSRCRGSANLPPR